MSDPIVQDQAAAEPKPNNCIEDQADDIRWHIGLSIRYHMRRVAFFDAYNRWTNVLGILFGSATVVTVLNDWGAVWPISASFLVTVLFTIDLVVGSNRKSRQFHDLAKRFIELEQRIVTEGLESDANIKNLKNLILSIEKDEPPILQGLNDLCFNEMVIARGLPEKKLLKLPLYKRYMANFISFEPHT